ncbi:hypothetical protein [Fluviicola sp.]|uniref:hypothetical protein n=1 Tax=Fluviicola sp. TaxID=1917219 RepID=UPI0031D70DC4
MIPHLPIYIPVIFGLTTIATLWMFTVAMKKSSSEVTKKRAIPVLIGLLIWLVIQAALTLTNSYNTDPDSFPPRIMLLGIFPAILAIVLLFSTRGGRRFIDSLPLRNLTYLHTIRIPVEIVLYWLSIQKAIPELMTFEGRNLDIFAGITAPFIAYFGVVKSKLNKQLLLAWNIICLGLLLNIVMNALLSAPSPIQKFAFDQPNIAILNFPFSWLPTVIVPIVLFSHLSAIRQLLQRSSK